MQHDARRSVGSRLSRIALVDVGKPDAVAGRILDIRGEAFYFDPVTYIGRGDVQGEQMAQRVRSDMHLRAALAFGAVIAGAGAAFRRRVQRATANDRCDPRFLPPGGRAQQSP